MTAEEWDAARRSDWMMIPLCDWGKADPHRAVWLDRKCRLAVVAWCRQRWELFDRPIYREAVEAGERLAEGLATRDELSGLYDEIMALSTHDARQHEIEEAVLKLIRAHGPQALVGSVMSLGLATGWADFEAVTVAHAPLLRCIVGNPFRPVAIDPDWLTPTVDALARGIYDERAFDRLPVLADALDDAGCDQPDILGHLRGPGPHARGCWVVDLMLGKG